MEPICYSSILFNIKYSLRSFWNNELSEDYMSSFFYYKLFNSIFDSLLLIVMSFIFSSLLMQKNSSNKGIYVLLE